MSDVKGYVVRGTDSDGLVTWAMGGTHAGDGPPASAPDRDSATEYGDIATANMVAGMFAEEHDVTASVYRVYADGREERLPDLAEALAEIERLTIDRDTHERVASTWRTTADGYCDTIAERDKEIERLRAVSLEGKDALAWGRMEETVGVLWNAYNLGDPSILTQAVADVLDAWHGCVDRKIIPPKPRDDADALAALEAAEQRLLVSERWTPGDRGFWTDPDDGTQWPKGGALEFVRRKLAAKKGGA